MKLDKSFGQLKYLLTITTVLLLDFPLSCIAQKVGDFLELRESGGIVTESESHGINAIWGCDQQYFLAGFDIEGLEFMRKGASAF